jgi:hypothetical protein
MGIWAYDTSQAELWKNDYGEVLLTTSNALLTKLQDRITLLETQVSAETSDLEQLKFVLNVIAELANLMQDVELEMIDITERYRTLARYCIPVPEEEMGSAQGIDKRWRTLYCDSRTRDLRLIDTKQQFREVTSTQDLEFRDLLTNLRKEFLDAGPGVSTVTLDAGVELLAEYKRKVNKLNKVKAELINAQNLFNLDVKPYPELQQTIVNIEQLSKIYGLYTSFKDFQVGVVCQYVIVIELHKMHVIVFLSIFPMPRTKSELLTFFTYMAYADWSFCSTYNVFSFSGIWFILYLVSMTMTYDTSQENMSSMLWGDLDITLLQKGAEEFEKSAKKFPKDLKEIFTFKMVEAKLANFKEALPLVVNLKNDAMKSR